jgi:response regulator RpfG family c-di-GMP phosphodiesterase
MTQPAAPGPTPGPTPGPLSSEDAAPAQPRGPLRGVVVDDHAMFRTGVKAEIGRALRAESFALDHAGNGEDAHHLGDTEQYDAVALDLGLPRRDGLRNKCFQFLYMCDTCLNDFFIVFTFSKISKNVSNFSIIFIS